MKMIGALKIRNGCSCVSGFAYMCCLVAMLLSCGVAYGSDKEQAKVKAERIRKIGLYNIRLGGEVAGYRENYMASLRADFTFGSRFTIWGASAGIGYRTINPFVAINKEAVSVRHFPIYLSAELHPWRFETGYLYIGAEGILNLSLGGRHLVSNQRRWSSDSNLSKTCIVGRANLGVKFKNVGIYAFYEYDLQPSVNQKYIYETVGYGYKELKSMIFERCRVGVGVSYYFCL